MLSLSKIFVISHTISFNNVSPLSLILLLLLLFDNFEEPFSISLLSSSSLLSIFSSIFSSISSSNF
jgi:hypothetical protein